MAFSEISEMNNMTKSIVKDSLLFDEEEGVNGLYYCHKMTYDATKGLDILIRGVVEESIKAIELERDCQDEIDSDDPHLLGYREGYERACNDAIEDIRVRFGV